MGLTISFTIANLIPVPLFIVFIHYNKRETGVNLRIIRKEGRRIDYSPEVNILRGLKILSSPVSAWCY